MSIIGTPVVQASSTAASNFPPKPANWSIYPGKLFLAIANQPGSDSNRPATGRGMTQLEIAMCEMWAWEDVLASLASKFSVCNWGDRPPFGLERPWNQLASAYYLQMENAGQTVDGRISPIWAAWIKMVQEQMDMFLSGDRTLMDGCTPIRFDPSQIGTLKIGIAGAPLTIFAREDDVVLDGMHVGGSLQEIQRLHGRYSISYGGQFPVTR